MSRPADSPNQVSNKEVSFARKILPLVIVGLFSWGLFRFMGVGNVAEPMDHDLEEREITPNRYGATTKDVGPPLDEFPGGIATPPIPEIPAREPPSGFPATPTQRQIMTGLTP